MTTLETRQDNWTECRPGTLGHYAIREKRQILKRRLIVAGSVASVCLMVALTWNVFVHPTTDNSNPGVSKEPNYGGIVCSSVKAVAKAHLAGTLDAETSQKIGLHLQECPRCRAFMEQLGNARADNARHRNYHERTVSFKAASDFQVR